MSRSNPSGLGGLNLPGDRERDEADRRRHEGYSALAARARVLADFLEKHAFPKNLDPKGTNRGEVAKDMARLLMNLSPDEKAEFGRLVAQEG